MAITGKNGTRQGGATPAVLIAGAVGLLALPSAVLAFSTSFDMGRSARPAAGEIGDYAAGTVDPRLARAIAARPSVADGLFRFTPAGTASRPDRLVTVAVRVDPETARAITVRGVFHGALAAVQPPAPGIAEVHIAPTAYSLAVARDVKGLSAGSSLPPEIRRIEMPDLAAYAPSAGARPTPSRFAPRIALDEHEKPGRAPRTFEGAGEQTVDFGGSYQLSRNIDVTAGVRYSQDRDRLAPLADGKQNTQAVYVGTQFRF